MRTAPLLLRGTAAAALASLAAACVIPPTPLGPRPDEASLNAPDVAFVNLGAQPTGSGGGTLVYSLTRNAYTAMFGVDQLGRVRVISPATPQGQTLLEGGRAYLVPSQWRLQDRELLTAVQDFDRVPYVFVLTSDTPLDLSAFGSGRAWGKPLTTRRLVPDSTIAEIATRVLPDAPGYGFDYAYLGPQLRVAEQSFAAECERPLEDVHDYGYFRDLWAVFTPTDQRLSINPYWLFTPALGWSSYGVLPLATYRAEFAPAVFYAGCTAPSSTYYAASYYGGPFGSWGYGYRPFWGPFGLTGPATIPAPRIAPVVSLRIPVTPLALGTTQVTGTTPSTTPGNASVLNGGVLGGRALSWRTIDGARAPGEVQRPGVTAFNGGVINGSGIAGRPNGWQGNGRTGMNEAASQRIHPIERRGFEHQPSSFGSASVSGNSAPRWTPRAEDGGRSWNNGGGNRSPSFTPPPSAPMSAPQAAPHVAPQAAPAAVSRGTAQTAQ